MCWKVVLFGGVLKKEASEFAKGGFTQLEQSVKGEVNDEVGMEIWDWITEGLESQPKMWSQSVGKRVPKRTSCTSRVIQRQCAD